MTSDLCQREGVGTYNGQCLKPMPCPDHPTADEVRERIAALRVALDAAKRRKDTQ